MLSWSLALLGGALFAALAHARGARVPTALPLLRATAATLILALLLDAPLGPSRPVAPHVAVDVSASWVADGDPRAWEAARQLADSLLRDGADSLLLFGEAPRTDSFPERPTDAASSLAPLVEAAQAAGRPLLIITDGRVDDAGRMADLPRGSQVLVPTQLPRTDVGIVAVDAPRAALIGDSLLLRMTLRADSAPTAPRTLEVTLGGRALGRATVPALSAFAEHEVALRAAVPPLEGEQPLRLALSDGDAVAANDTLAQRLAVRGTASAILISTAPDQDARQALAALRRTQRGAVRGYWRVAPGVWREGDALRPITEAEVRRALGAAGLVLLHGDTAHFGAPRRVARGALVLLPSITGEDEFYVTEAGESPLRIALGALPVDALPPLRVGAAPAPAAGAALLARRARRGEARAVVLLREAAPRTVVVAANGLWRWRARGGRPAEAFDALWGSIFDWVAEASATDAALPMAVPAPELVPRRPSVASGPVGAAPVRDLAPRARAAWCLAALALLALSAEWMLRRRIGWR